MRKLRAAGGGGGRIVTKFGDAKNVKGHRNADNVNSDGKNGGAGSAEEDPAADDRDEDEKFNDEAAEALLEMLDQAEPCRHCSPRHPSHFLSSFRPDKPSFRPGMYCSPRHRHRFNPSSGLANIGITRPFIHRILTSLLELNMMI